MPPTSMAELQQALQQLYKQGYVETHRAGDTGIGKTLEDRLGIVENNDAAADLQFDGHQIELKSARADSNNPVSLFTKEPPKQKRRYWNNELIDAVGYNDGHRDALYATVTTGEPNPQGLSLDWRNSAIVLEHEELGRLARWPARLVARKVRKKFPEVLFVSAQTRGSGDAELFFYNQATYLRGSNVSAFRTAIRDEALVVELRMHAKSDDAVRNHGTAWRIDGDKLPMLFDEEHDLLAKDEVDEDIERGGQRFLSDYT